MKIAVIGCGSIGKRHIRNLYKEHGMRELLLFDVFDGMYAELVEELEGVEGTTSMERVWEWEPEVVFVLSPSNYHLEAALEAAKRGCHLFVEKPVSHNLEGLDELMAVVEEKQVVTFVGCNMRYHPGPATVNKLVGEGRVGRVLSARIKTGSFLPSWRPGSDYTKSYSASTEYGGAILDCIHELDLALWLLGPAQLGGCLTLPAEHLGLATDGASEILLAHENGSVSSVHLSFMQRNYKRCIEVVGETGTLEWDFVAGKVDVYGDDGQVSESVAQEEDWEVNKMYVDEIAHFLKCVESGETATGNDVATATKTLALALEIRGKGMVGKDGEGEEGSVDVGVEVE